MDARLFSYVDTLQKLSMFRINQLASRVLHFGEFKDVLRIVRSQCCRNVVRRIFILLIFLAIFRAQDSRKNCDSLVFVK